MKESKIRKIKYFIFSQKWKSVMVVLITILKKIMFKIQEIRFFALKK